MSKQIQLENCKICNQLDVPCDCLTCKKNDYFLCRACHNFVVNAVNKYFT